MIRIIGIYKITSPNRRIYIGQSKNINLRTKYYKSNNCKGQIKIYNSIKKYGWEKHKFEIIHQCKEVELNELEKYYIELYQTYNSKHGLNLKEGGDCPPSWLGKKHSEETRKKMSQWQIGKPSKHLGHKHSDLTKIKISKSKIGKKRKSFSEETKYKMRIARIGKKFPRIKKDENYFKNLYKLQTR